MESTRTYNTLQRAFSHKETHAGFGQRIHRLIRAVCRAIKAADSPLAGLCPFGARAAGRIAIRANTWLNNASPKSSSRVPVQANKGIPHPLGPIRPSLSALIAIGGIFVARDFDSSNCGLFRRCCAMRKRELPALQTRRPSE
jgi:hypothetical protein